ncbi:MAG: DUF3169 family protein [Lachnospiraceae bacterium]|nr:DUF3169 family protein [Lachnospiraceae bacterium]
MSQEHLENIKKEDKKQGKKYMLILLASFVVGGVGGFLSAVLADVGAYYNVPEMLSKAVRYTGIYYNLVATVLLCIVVMLLHKKSKAIYKAWDGEDENVIEKVERYITVNLIIVGIHSILYLIFITIGFVELLGQMESGIFSAVNIAVMAVGFVISSIFTVKAQQILVNFTKEINPEKRGSVYDSKFQKKWLESCDEMEKMKIYECGYAAYKSISVTCMTLDVLCLLGFMMFDIGIAPICVIGVIWIVSALSYYIKGIQLEKRKSK